MVFYSRKATLQDAKAALAAGALDVLAKPASSREQAEVPNIAGDFLTYCRSQPPAFLVSWLKKAGSRMG